MRSSLHCFNESYVCEHVLKSSKHSNFDTKSVRPFTHEAMCGLARDTAPWQPLSRVSDSRVGSIERSNKRVIFLSFCVLKHCVLGVLGVKR